MKHLITVLLATSSFAVTSLCAAMSPWNPHSSGADFMTMYRDWLTPFNYQTNMFAASGGMAEEGSFSLELSGSSYDYSHCLYTGAKMDDYVCEESATPITTTSLMTKIMMPYRVALRPSRRANAVDMSMAVDLRMALSFTDGETTVTLPDARLAGKVIVKNNTKNAHFYVSAFELPLDKVVMPAEDKEEIEAIVTLVKAKLLHTWYFTRLDAGLYDEVMELMKLSTAAMPLDMEALVKVGVIKNLGWDNALGMYRLTINIDRLPALFTSWVDEDMMTDAMKIESEDMLSYSLSGSLGQTAGGHVALSIDNTTVSLDEETTLILSDCSLAAAWTACAIAINGSGSTLTIAGSGYNDATSGAMSLTASIVEKDMVGTASMTSQRKQSDIRDADFALPRQSKSRKKAMENLETMF